MKRILDKIIFLLFMISPGMLLAKHADACGGCPICATQMCAILKCPLCKILIAAVIVGLVFLIIYLVKKNKAGQKTKKKK